MGKSKDCEQDGIVEEHELSDGWKHFRLLPEDEETGTMSPVFQMYWKDGVLVFNRKGVRPGNKGEIPQHTWVMALGGDAHIPVELEGLVKGDAFRRGLFWAHQGYTQVVLEGVELPEEDPTKVRSEIADLLRKTMAE